MTSEASPHRSAAPPLPPPQSSQCEAVIDEQLHQTQLQVKGVDIAAGLLTLGIGVIAYLFALALADHWLVTGGLGFHVRLVALVVLAAGSGVFCYFRVLRPLLWKINPVFVAHTIEEHRPSLKNSLVNFLLLRGQSRGISPVVYRAIETRAAGDLADVSPEAVVDRRHVVWLAAAFVVLILLGGIYHIASPKSPLTSVFRIAWPWTAAPVPTRVTITDVEPGDAAAFFGQTIAVSAEVSGVSVGEPVTLCFDTADGQSVGEAVPMRLPEEGYRYRCELPPGKLGLLQDMQYYLSAGDCKTKKYTLTVQTPPVIEVERIDYQYPSYTEIPDRSAARQGDVRAVEGTKITIHAAANMPIREAEIDLNCDSLHSLKMKSEGKNASGGFTLGMRGDDPTQPRHDCYQLRFSDAEGRKNPRPIRYGIDVIADLPPRVELIDPPGDHVELPENGALRLSVEAEDADFALGKVTIRGECNGRGLPIRAMLNKVAGEPPHKGLFEGDYSFEPAALGLKAGDQAVYWAEAADNKTPLPNVAETQRLWITVVEPTDENNQKEQDKNGRRQDDSPKGENQQNQNDQQQGQQGEQPQGQQQGEDQQGQGQQGNKQQSEARQGSDEPSEPIDGESNPGDVFDKALEHIEKQQEKQKNEQSKTQKTEQQPGEGEQGEQKPAEQKPGEGEQGEQKPAEQKPGEGDQGEQKPAEQKPGEGDQGEQKPAEQKSGEGEQGKRDQKGEKTKSDRQESEKPSSQGQNGAPSGRNPSDWTPGEDRPPEVQEPTSEEFNKQYADEATDLVLEEFQKQLAQKKPDQELLDSLGGWTREDLERFTKRWLEMKRSAKEQSAPSAKRELDDALRSLGLDPSRTDIRGGTAKDDVQRLRRHRRIPPPPDWAPQTRAYKQSIGSRDNGDE